MEMIMPADDTVRALIVDDDAEFAHLVAQFLRDENGYKVTTRYDGQSGVRAALDARHDIIVLDVGLPKMNGFDVLRAIRQECRTPVIMLTARGDDVDRILGLESGADDYVPKPCNLRELSARIRAVLRRSSPSDETAEAPASLVVGDLRMEPGSHSVYIDGGLLPLTAAEYLVLEVLVELAGQVVHKDAVARHALGRRVMPQDRSIDVHISNLRKKLGPLADGRQRIKTIRGRGYLYVTVS